MTDPTNDGLRLERGEGCAPLTSIADVNEAAAEVGLRVWPLDLRAAPADVRRSLDQPSLTDAEMARIKDCLLLGRERLLEIIAGAGRRPHVAGGGALVTTVTSQGYSYPQLWMVSAGADYRRFDRFHVNVADDGTGVDEILQILSGGGVRIVQRRPGGGALTLTLACPRQHTGWLVTYDGGNQHMGSLSRAEPGTKVLVQAIGPARWSIRYENEP